MATKRTKQAKKSGKGLKRGKKIEAQNSPLTFQFKLVAVKT